MASRIPAGFHTLTPYIVVDDAKAAIELYKAAFGAEVTSLANTPDGKVMNAQLKIGDSMLMLNDEFPEHGVVGPKKIGGTAVTLHMYVEDVDAAWERAVAAGLEVGFPLADQFWGDRYGQLKDSFGHSWSMASKLQG
ncbi:VOC family protein [Fimbriimonas ginsengisoli]|uniref:Glyoxalase/bleomycin resistance protein/dioxygenase n=1 Tax=Fimbriimonas ginsengisoli Gsoil 348 TaxID=661478 RepID=A0A068NU19_FIMGI|nr:VOC family protein [Fimbriimonas ginsengisoli]AIE86275.1 Glyoxalase/bleomycin resistance protein/dioxygenase [Fimbriimonas ginsengisoli Gsoil 348]